MPHVVLNGTIDLDQVFGELSPLFFQEQDSILKTMDYYISKIKNNILVETLVIEKGNKLQYFSLISKRDDGLVVRIYPGTEIEKTSNVKRVLAEIAKKILEFHPEMKIGKTNLSEFLE